MKILFFMCMLITADKQKGMTVCGNVNQKKMIMSSADLSVPGNPRLSVLDDIREL